MPILAAFALANLKHDMAGLWGWLCHRSFWQLVSMGLLALFMVQHFQLIGARHEATKWQRQYALIHTQLDAISTARNNQAAETKTRIETVTKIIHDADGRAKAVENAPPAPNCKTKPEVLQADL